jgi:hypothetical protein
MLRRIAPAVLTIAIAAPAIAQESKTSAVQPASFTRTAAAAAPQTVEFGRQGPHIGDQVEQRIALEMRLATSLRQDDKLLEKNDTTMRNTQRRAVTTTEVLDGRTQAVLVRYPEATKQMAIGPDANKAPTDGKPPETKNSEPVSQPVEGKAYRCRREPGEDGKLIVTDADGMLPPIEEFTIVAQSMEMVGRPNPLAEFLAGRKVAVGETLPLPKNVADRLFGIGERFGDVSRFDLTLEEVRTENGRSCAAFRASVDAGSTKSSQMRMQVEGPLVIDVASCRAVRTKLTGPIAMTESRGTYSTAYQLISTGHLTIAIDAAYRDADR